MFNNGITVDPTKVETIVKWKQPKSPTEMHSFLDLIGYYRRFIKNSLKITGFLTDLTKNHDKFVWNTRYETNFQELKK